MPCLLLRDGRVVADEWTYLAASADAAAGSDAHPAHGLILTFDQWLADRTRWLAADTRLGVVLSPAHRVEQLAPDLPRFELIAAEFPGPSEGRGYTQGRMLRERHRFAGELRAIGFVRRDQLFFMARCGFNSFELPETEIADVSGFLSTYTARYQPANDAGLGFKLQHR